MISLDVGVEWNLKQKQEKQSKTLPPLETEHVRKP